MPPGKEVFFAAEFMQGPCFKKMLNTVHAIKKTVNQEISIMKENQKNPKVNKYCKIRSHDHLKSDLQ